MNNSVSLSKSTYRLGTRKSLLAIAQSSWVARELERLNLGIKIELVGIETRGDIILDKPLSQIEGKEFFTAELDHALIRGEVDFSVHSMKDLSLERPPQITLAGVPKREFAHDILIFNDSVISRLKQGLPIRIGTSSPRRLTLIPEFLKTALPRFENKNEPILQFVEIRGNVNTRLSKIHEPETSDRKLDAVVLAFAGLERLALDTTASLELNKLLVGTRKMIVPLRTSPSAPAQGALAIEARADASETLSIIQKLHDPETLFAVSEERKVLAEWGGGCHLKLGASYLPDHTLVIRGVKPNGERVCENRGQKKQSSDYLRVDAGDFFDFAASPLTSEQATDLKKSEQIFIAHPRAYTFLELNHALHADSQKRVWVSGMKSWTTLAQLGVWIEGSVEGAGFKKMREFESKKLLALNSGFLFITHDEAQKHMDHAVSTYHHRFREIPEKVKQAPALFWTSGLLFRTAWSKLGANFMLTKKHASGPGRTAEVLGLLLKPHGVTADVFTLES
jgi:hydroxymethylbilane synthase